MKSSPALDLLAWWEDRRYGRRTWRVLFGVATGLAYAAFLLVQRQGSMDLRRPGGALFDMSLVAAIVSLACGLALGVDDLAPSWPSAAWLVTLAPTSQVVGWLLITVSLPRLPAAMTSIILTIQPIGSVALGAVLLGRDPSLLQLCGVAMILAGLVSVALRPNRGRRRLKRRRRAAPHAPAISSWFCLEPEPEPEPMAIVLGFRRSGFGMISDSTPWSMLAVIASPSPTSTVTAEPTVTPAPTPTPEEARPTGLTSTARGLLRLLKPSLSLSRRRGHQRGGLDRHPSALPRRAGPPPTGPPS